MLNLITDLLSLEQFSTLTATTVRASPTFPAIVTPHLSFLNTPATR